MAERLRGRAGQAQRLRRLLAEPLCRICAERGRVEPSVVPDHIKPLAQGGTDDDDNIRCLCKPCHDEVTAEQFGQRKAGIGAVDQRGMPTDPAHPWNQAAAPCEIGATTPAQRIGAAQVTRARRGPKRPS